MKNNLNPPFGANFKAGTKIRLTEENLRNLPFGPEDRAGVEALFVAGDEGYRIIPLRPDVKKIYIEATTWCNFDCITCIRGSWQDSLRHMDRETFESIKRALPDLPDLECVHFGGFGEPFSHPEIFDMLKSVKDLGLRTEVITNGSLLTGTAISKLIELKVDMVYVSLDAPDREEYNRIRQGNVNHKPLPEIWKEEDYVNFRLAVKNFKFPSCPDCKYLEGCSMADSNEMDCWGNSPSCAECLWSRQLIACP